MSAREAFRELLDVGISPFLRPRGFQRHGYGYQKWIAKNCQLILFGVDHRRSDQSQVLFSVTLGTISGRLWWFETDQPRPSRFPLPQDWHWISSLATLDPKRNHDGSGNWWSIQEKHQVRALADELGKRLALYGIPSLDAYVSDESLRDLYHSGRGGTEFQVLYRLAYLLSAIGPESELVGVLGKLRTSSKGQRTETRAEEYALRIESLMTNPASSVRQ